MNKSAFLFVGDPFLVEQKVESLIQAIQKENPGEIACQVYNLSESALEAILTQARTLPFFSVAQIFRLRQIERLKKTDLEFIADYLNHPPRGTYLVFEAQELEKTHELVKRVRSAGEVHFLDESQKKDASIRFIQEKLKHFGKSMTSEALNLLQEEAGEHPVLLDSMLDRLIFYAGNKSQIDESMVETFHEELGYVNVFELTDALASRQTGAALALLHKLMEDQEKDWVALLGLVHWQIRRLWRAKVSEEEGVPDAVILRKIRISPRQMPSFTRQLKSFSRGQLETALEGLFQLDWKMKTGQVEGPSAFEAWVVQTTSP